MNTYSEFRKSNRIEHKATVMIVDEPAEYFSYGQMINYSAGGIGFWSDFAFKPWVRINIRLDNPLFKAAPKTYRGIVRWCKELEHDESQFLYGVGVKYF